MPRCAGTLAGLLLALLAAPPARAETELGSIAVRATGQATATSDVLLKRGVRYRLVVSGTSTVSSGSDSSSYDALYCFGSTSSQCASPFPEPAAFSIGLSTNSVSEPSTDTFPAFTDSAYPPYAGGHSYSASFTPGVDGRLFLRAWPGYGADDGVSRSGSFTVTIYGPDTAGCDEPDQDLENDRGTCDYRADFEVRLDTRPTPGEAPAHLRRIEIRSKGVLLFGRRVKVDELAQARVEGYFTLTLRYAADPNFNGGRPWVAKFKIKLTQARVRYSRKERVLDIDSRIVDHSQPGNHISCEGLQGVLRLTQRGGRANDRIKVRYADADDRRSCLEFVGVGDALKVTIDRPVKI